MKNVEPYLIFNGNCEEAFTFYQSVFEVKIAAMMRYNQMPEDDQRNDTPDEEGNRIVHVLLPVSSQVYLMGSDAPSSMKMTQGDNVSLTLNVESEAEARQIFDRLSEGGKVTMPLDKTFWADLYAMITDKFGIHWMINFVKGK